MDQVSIAKSELRFQQWTKLVAECQSSQMTVKAWCELNNINIKTYYYWLRKIRTAATEVLEPQLVRLEEPERAEADSKIHIRYGEAELSLPEDVDLEAVTVLLNALRRHD